MTILGLLDTGAHAVGIANIAMDGTVLDTWFPHPELSTSLDYTGTVRLGAQHLSPKMLSLVKLDEDRMVEQVAVKTSIASLAKPPIDAHDAYLRLHLLSHRMVRPHEVNIDGLMDCLATVVWTNKGPCLPDNFEFVRTSLRSRGLIHVYGIDRLPRMVDYVVPTGVHIAEAERVRLGAYLAPGTSVMREGYVSFNCGTLGPAKVEGRLSSSVLVGEGTNIGLSALIRCKRLPEGGREPLTIGQHCVLGVSAGIIGVPLGDDCRVGNNVIIEPDTPVYFADTERLGVASEIAGQARWQLKMEPGHLAVVARRL